MPLKEVGRAVREQVIGVPRNRDALTAVNVNHTGAYPNYQYASFTAQTAKLDWIIAPQLTFTPFRGKLAIFNKIFVDTDFNISGGAAFVGIHERANCGAGGQPTCDNPSSFTLSSSTRIAPTFAAGLTFYPGELWSPQKDLRVAPHFAGTPNLASSEHLALLTPRHRHEQRTRVGRATLGTCDERAGGEAEQQVARPAEEPIEGEGRVRRSVEEIE